MSIVRVVLLLLVLTFSLFSAPVMTWIPPYAVDACQTNLQNPAVNSSLTHLSLQFWVPDGPNVAFSKYQGTQFDDTKIRAIRDYARSKGIKTMLCVYNNTESKSITTWPDADAQGWSWNMAINSFSTNKSAFITSLITEMKRLDLDGIEIDLEGPGKSSHTTEFISFMRDLSTAVKAEGKDLTVATFASDYSNPGPNDWDELLPLVDALTTMGYQETGISARAKLSYREQKAYASAAPEKFMIGMPSWYSQWPEYSWGDDNNFTLHSAQDQVDWVVSDGEVGMAIWDLQLENSSWSPSNNIWNSIASIRGVLPTQPEVRITSGADSYSTERRPSFTWAGTDPDGTIAKYYYGMDNSSPTTQSTATSFTVPTDLSFGAHTFYVQAEDNDGNKSPITSWSFAISDGTGGPNLLTNGDFSNGNNNWPFKYQSGAAGAGSVVNGSYEMQMSRPGSYVWTGSVGQYGIPIEKEKMYEVSFDAKATSATKFYWVMQHDGTVGNNWKVYGDDTTAISTQMQRYTHRFIMSETSDPAACFFIQIGLTSAKITVDNISIREVPIGTKYTITTTAGSDGTIFPAGSVEVIEGFDKTFTISATDPTWKPLTDVLIDGVSKGPISSYTFSNVSKNHTIEAVFTAKPKFTITTTATGSSANSISPNGVVEVPGGSNKTFSISATDPVWAPLTDVIVDGVSKGPISSHTFSNVTENHTIEAVFTAKPKFTITTSVTGSSDNSISPNGVVEVPGGSNKTFSITSGSAGFSELQNVIIDGVNKGSISSHTFSDINENHTIEAIYTGSTPTDNLVTWGTWKAVVDEYDSYINVGNSSRPKLVTNVIANGNASAEFELSQTFEEIKEYTWGQLGCNIGDDNNLTGVTHIVVTYKSTDGAYIVLPQSNLVDGGYFKKSLPHSGGFVTDTFEVASFERALWARQQYPNVSLDLSLINEVLFSFNGSLVGWSGDEITISDLRLYGYQSNAFEVNLTQKPSVVTEDRKPTFIWEGSSSVVKYNYSIDDNTSFTQTTNLTHTPASELNFGQHVFYIYGEDASGTSTDTVQYSFTVEDTGPVYHTISTSFIGKGSFIPADPIKVVEGHDIQISVIPDEGYGIEHLAIDAVNYDSTSTYTFRNVQERKSLYAAFVPLSKTYALHVNVPEHATVTPNENSDPTALIMDYILFGHNSKTYTIIPDEGYAVSQITIGDSTIVGETSFTLNNVRRDNSVRIEMQALPQVNATVTGGTIAPEGITIVNAGTNKQIQYSPLAGYQLKEIKVNDVVEPDSVNSYTFKNIQGLNTIDVTYEPSPSFSITSSTTGSGTISPLGEQQVTEGGSQQFTFEAATGYFLKELLINEIANTDSADSYTFKNVTENHEITVTFEQLPTYTVTTSVTDGTITPSPTVTENDNVQISYQPKVGFRFNSITVDGVISADSTASYTFTNVTENHTIAVEYEAIPTYTISTIVTGGTISPTPSTTVTEGDDVQITYEPEVGYRFKTITVNDVVSTDSTASYTFENVTANHTIVVEYEAVPVYTIAATVQGDGSITPSDATVVTEGGEQNYQFSVTTGNQLDSIQVDGLTITGVESYLFTNVTSNHQITAFFSKIPTFTITASVAEGNGTITPTGSKLVYIGSDQKYEYEAEVGSRLDSIYVDGAKVATVPSYSFLDISADHTIEVYFSEIPTYTITASITANGSIDPEGNTIVSEGDNLTYTITVNEGATLDSVHIDGDAIVPELQYIFSNVRKNSTIDVYISKKDVALNSFDEEQQLDITVANTVWTIGSENIPVIIWGDEIDQLQQANIQLFDVVGNKLLEQTLSPGDLQNEVSLIDVNGVVWGSGTYLLVIRATDYEGSIKGYQTIIGAKR